MRRSGVWIGLGVLYALPANAVEDSWAFSVRPEIGPQVGSEAVSFEAVIPQDVVDGEVTARSKLTYPQTFLVVGGAAGFEVGRLAFVASLRTNLTDPWTRMIDQDYVELSSLYASDSIEFSHTDSRATLRTWSATGEVRVRVAEPSKTTSVAVLGGFRYESHEFEIYGASGWQLAPDESKIHFSVPESLHALSYRAVHHAPFGGARIDAQLGPKLHLGAEGRLFGAWSTHEDDHVLRNKLATGTTQSMGIGLSAEPKLDLGGGSAARFFGGFGVEVEYMGAVGGKLSQEFYADDPSIPGNQRSEAIPDAKLRNSVPRARLLAFVEARF